MNDEDTLCKSVASKVFETWINDPNIPLFQYIIQNGSFSNSQLTKIFAYIEELQATDTRYTELNKELREDYIEYQRSLPPKLRIHINNYRGLRKSNGNITCRAVLNAIRNIDKRGKNPILSFGNDNTQWEPYSKLNRYIEKHKSEEPKEPKEKTTVVAPHKIEYEKSNTPAFEYCLELLQTKKPQCVLFKNFIPMYKADPNSFCAHDEYGNRVENSKPPETLQNAIGTFTNMIKQFRIKLLDSLQSDKNTTKNEDHSEDIVNIIPQQLKPFKFIKLGYQTKDPLKGVSWSDPKNWMMYDEAEEYLTMTGNNIGVIFNSVDSIFGIDMDIPPVFTKLIETLGDTFTVRSGRETGGKHVYYKLIEPIDSDSYKLLLGKEAKFFNLNTCEEVGEIHMFRNSRQFVAPPSIHPATKNRYTIDKNIPITEVTYRQLQEAIALLGKANIKCDLFTKPTIKKNKTIYNKTDEESFFKHRPTCWSIMEPKNFETVITPTGISHKGTHPKHGSESKTNLQVWEFGWLCRRCNSKGGVREYYCMANDLVKCDYCESHSYNQFPDSVKKEFKRKIKQEYPLWYGEIIQAETYTTRLNDEINQLRKTYNKGGFKTRKEYATAINKRYTL